MKKAIFKFRFNSIYALVAAICCPVVANAAAIPLAQFPAGTASRQPAPNIIVSVDDSGSMGAVGIATLKDALKQTFSSANIPDDQIRIAWQSMNGCNGIPNAGTNCASKNVLKSLSGTHRTSFLTWVDTLTPSGGTSSHKLMRNAGDYLSRTDLGINSPWASAPGTTLAPVLSCRKSYNIFMTDGGWNSSSTSLAGHVDGDRKTAAYTVIGGGNADGTNRTLGDGATSYTANSNETKVFSDPWGFGGTDGLNTLSDVAFHYWATDLQPGISNNVKPSIKKTGPETFGTGVDQKVIPEFWNPKNDPATWQHMVTYSIGFAGGAETWIGAPAWGGDTYSGDYSELVQGIKSWPSPLCSANNTGSGNQACDGTTGYVVRANERLVELWHMAINGRGKFVKAQSAQALVDAFKDIVTGIVADNSTPISSFASSQSSVTRAAGTQYASGYAAAGWSGYVRSETLAQGTGQSSPNADWGVKAGIAPPNNYVTTADKLDALTVAQLDQRLVLSSNSVTNAGVSFQWSSTDTLLSAPQKLLLNADAKGEDRVKFLRGDRTKEGGTTTAPFRIRASRHGDIVNSSVWYVGSPSSNFGFDSYRTFAASQKARLPMIYVGANDGMLHGFSAKDGSEKIAYVPKGVIKNMPLLSDPGYSHAYYVDGSPFSGDVNVNSVNPDWRTFLVGTLGAGGKGYYILDVTKPGTTATDGTGIATNFAVANAAALVVMDKSANKDDATAGEAEDIGHIFASPVVEDFNPQKVTQIAKMNDGRWAVVLGNGYNSKNERPVLLIQYLDGAKELKTMVATATGANVVGNGLSAPRLVDINGDGTPDVIYAGDLKGNMWKFDVSSKTATDWTTAFNGAPLYAATFTSGGTTTAQPITAAPVVRRNSAGGVGLMVSFGTGRNISESDRTDKSVQSIYSVLDNTRYKTTAGAVVVDDAVIAPAALGSGVSKLVQQIVSTTEVIGAGASTGRTFGSVTQNDVPYDGAGAKKGWYLNLPKAGERILDPMTFFDGSNILEIVSEVPGSGGSVTEETCDPQPTLPQKFRTFLNVNSGKKPSVQILDANGDGFYNASDSGVSRVDASNKEARASGLKTETRKGSDGKVDAIAKLPEVPLRPSWRQLQ